MRLMADSRCTVKTAANKSNLAADRCYNIALRFREACSLHRDLIAVSDSNGGKSYRWLECQASQIAARLQARTEFNQRDHVGLFLENSPEYVAAFYGVVLAGGVVVPIPTYYRNPRLLELCNLADLKVFVDSPESTNQDDELPFSNAELVRLAHDSDSGQLAPDLEQDPDSLAMLLLTSGSTGDPKAVMLSHRNVIANTESICSFLPITSSDRALATTPFAHALGNSVVQTHILSGAQIVVEKDLQFPPNLAKALHANHCTSLTAVPEVFESLLSAFGTGEASLPGLK